MKHFLFILLCITTTIVSYAQSITPEQAKDSVGKMATVCGVVTGVHAAAIGVTFLNMGGKYPNNAFTVVVFKDNVGKFSYELGTLDEKEICVMGMIKDFKGKPEIVADSEKQIVVKKEERE